MNEKEIIKQRIKKRLENKKIFNFLNYLELKSIYLAGNSLNASTPKDYDFFFKREKDFLEAEKRLEKRATIITTNAITVTFNKTILQFCKYFKPSLKELVESFDFAHIKLGIELQKNNTWKVSEIYLSEDFIKARIVGDSFYTGSEYPLASLNRLFKYYKREEISRVMKNKAFLQILIDIVRRGFKDYEDFLKQIEAVDLTIPPDDFALIPRSLFTDLYNLLKREEI